MSFAELLGHSCFSFLEGASQPEEMVARARELDLLAFALCDRDGLYGSVRAHGEAKKNGQRLIIGAELTLATSAMTGAGDAGAGTSAASLALLVQDQEGYANLCRLLTQAHIDKDTCHIGLDAILGASGGLVAILPLGDGSLVQAGLLGPLRDAFGERALVATWRHLDGRDAERTAAAVAAAERFGLGAVASARPLFHHVSRKPVADVFHCIKNGTTLDRAGTALASNAEAYLRSAAQMHALFRDRPEWVARTVEVADTCRFSLDQIHYRFPGDTLCERGESADAALRRLVEAGCRLRYPAGTPPAVRAQLDKELVLIAELDVAPYFLSVREIVEIARDKRILCQGRGSAANSAVCFVLGVTAVDPARSNLLFERFLSAERSEPPDIDVDFEHERREEVIQAIYQRYGRDRSAMVSEVISYRGKSALREVGKAFGLSLEEVDKLSGLVTHYDSAEIGERRLAETGLDPSDARLRQAVLLARAIEGFPRHLSIHVGGFVLSSEPLCHVAPIEPARMEARTVIPWDKDDIDELGFFKVDVLGLGMLTAIRKALAMVYERTRPGERFDPIEALARIPAEDPEVYEAIQHADTIGVFQIESRAQMAMLPRLRPKTFYDLVIEVAIVRPGPIQGGMVHPYLRRRTGKEPAEAPHPCLAPILARTLGVPLFQEQVMQIAMVGAGYTPGEADQLRRDMAAWKKHGRLARHETKLLAGFAKRGIPTRFAEQLYLQIQGFGEYGFPESHAASFALLVYASAWLKVHCPAAFACALLNSQPMGFYSASSIVRDAQKHGVTVLAVCVVASGWDNHLEGESLRLGMRQVKGMGEAAAQAIVAARAEAPFASQEDLVRRAKLKKNEVEALAEAGALSSLVPARREALWKARAPRAPGLFEGLSLEPAVSVGLPPLRPVEQLVLDYGRLGLCLDDHPMRHVRAERLRGRRVKTAADLAKTNNGERVAIAGLVIGRQRPATASGVTFVTLEDETGIANLVLQRHVYEKNWSVARHATILFVRGTLEREGEVIHVLVRELERLDLPDAEGLEVKSRDFH